MHVLTTRALISDKKKGIYTTGLSMGHFIIVCIISYNLIMLPTKIFCAIIIISLWRGNSFLPFCLELMFVKFF
jgi:hypothetical protein